MKKDLNNLINEISFLDTRINIDNKNSEELYNNLYNDFQILKKALYTCAEYSLSKYNLYAVFNIFLYFSKKNLLLKEIFEYCSEDISFKKFLCSVEKIIKNKRILTNQFIKKEVNNIIKNHIEFKEYGLLFYYSRMGAKRTQEFFNIKNSATLRQYILRILEKLENAGIYELLNIYNNPIFMLSTTKRNNKKIAEYITSYLE